MNTMLPRAFLRFSTGSVVFVTAALSALGPALAVHGTWAVTQPLTSCAPPSDPPPSDPNCPPRTRHTATLLPGGSVLVAGGDVAARNQDPKLTATTQTYSGGVWASASSMNYRRTNHTATPVNGGVLVIGGTGEMPNADPNNPPPPAAETVEIRKYDDGAGWTLLRPLLFGRSGHHTATVLEGPACVKRPDWCGDVLVAGASQPMSEVYDPDKDPVGGPHADSESRMGVTRRHQRSHTATLLDGPACRGNAPIPDHCGKVLVAGGCCTDGEVASEIGASASASQVGLSGAELWDPATNTWTSTESMTRAHSGHTATLLDGPACHALPPEVPPEYCGKVLVVGSRGPGELYDPFSGEWALTRGSMQASSRGDHSATRLDGPNCGDSCDMVLLVGGFGTESGMTELYDPDQDTFRQTQNGLQPSEHANARDPLDPTQKKSNQRREFHTATALSSGEVLVTGGEQSTNFVPIADAQVYTPGAAPVDLSILNADSPDPVARGADLTYTLTVANANTDSIFTARRVRVTDTLPAQVTFKSASASSGSCLHEEGTVSCALGDLPRGASGVVTIVVSPDQAGEISNTAGVSSASADSNQADNSATATTTVTDGSVEGEGRTGSGTGSGSGDQASAAGLGSSVSGLSDRGQVSGTGAVARRGTLPATGTDPKPLLALAATLILTGSVLEMLGRRRVVPHPPE